ncbi:MULTISPECIES: restriction endonuclease subunit S [Massilia]|uniref:Restriction endonuclease subunit S n=1 Tax=Massilia haematophila TaxID=457923 RepID=A0ABV7PTX2_9BURK|nr:restriction endonuclease subunit S [Massilia sp.]
MLQNDSSGAEDSLKPYLRAANIRWDGVDISDVKFMWFSPRDVENLRLQAGDLLVSEGGDVGRSAVWSNEMHECYIQNSVNRIRAKALDSTKYLFYWMATIKSKGYIDVLCNKSTIAHFTAEKVAEVPTPFPPVVEQIAIANFLDRETAKIDALIAEQEKLIALLAEKRQAAISHAVTRGLNPNSSMKESGVAWLGEVPAHWSITRLKYATDAIVDCPHETPVYDEAGSYRVIRTADVSEGRLHLDQMYSIAQPEFLLRIRRMSLEQNDIVYGREGERWGFAAQVPASERFCLGQRMMQFRAAAGINPRFLMWQLNAESTYRQGQVDTVGATSPHVNVSTIRNYALTHPPVGEQEEISKFLDAETSRLDKLDAESARTITLLKERRSALIAAAVTGQIDLRSATSPPTVKTPEAIAA